ncbi:MAG: Kae1-associated serine/threonine protein kinase [Candidatus Micrarchaeota archaeon]|nr:Kae1-associated serine/threonine protein kinase [Candidatus Micrarchaeota archaeon]
MRKIAEGAEADVFKAKLFGKTVIVKTRKRKKYRIRELDESIRKERTRIEARVLERAYSAGILVPKLLGVDSFSIYMGFVGGRLLKDTKPGSGMYEKLGRILGRMHDVDIVHGDFTPANIMIDAGSAYVIDFGLSEVSKSQEEKALDILLMKRAIGKGHYASFVKGYESSNKESVGIMRRLASIELRGRYQVRTLA